MSFRHIEVRTVEAQTQEHIQSQTNKLAAMDARDSGASGRFLANYVMLDGILVTHKCAVIANAFRKANRAVKFGMFQGSRCDWRGSIPIFDEVCAYLPGQTYILGRIGYCDWNVSGTEYKYFVYARGIKNDKFLSGRDQHHMSMSGDMKRVLDVAKKEMRPYTPIECARMTFYDFQRKINQAEEQLTSGYDTARRTLLGNTALRDELFLLLETGHTFHHPTLRDQISNWKKEIEIMKEARAKQAHGYYIQITTAGDQQSFEVIEVFDIKKGSNSSNWVVKNYSSDDMPEDLTEKVATLMMLDPMNYIEGVGMRTSDRAFWIERDQSAQA